MRCEHAHLARRPWSSAATGTRVIVTAGVDLERLAAVCFPITAPQGDDNEVIMMMTSVTRGLVVTHPAVRRSSVSFGRSVALFSPLQNDTMMFRRSRSRSICFCRTRTVIHAAVNDAARKNRRTAYPNLVNLPPKNETVRAYQCRMHAPKSVGGNREHPRHTSRVVREAISVTHKVPSFLMKANELSWQQIYFLIYTGI